MSRKKSRNKIDLDEQIPKALRKKKKVNDVRTKEQIKQELKEEKRRLNKKRKIKLIFFLIVTLILATIIFIVISIFKWKRLVTDMMVNETSIIYDTNENIIAEIGAEKRKEKVSISKIPDNLKNAYVAIEDQRYYSHSGIDIKRTTAAIGSYIIHFGKTSFGGSTITQQLVKNLTGDDSTSITRKVNEWIKAFGLETFLSKEEILEMYFNVIYVGPNIYGVQTGAQYYFSKDVSNLSLAECAYLAGLNHSPNSYNPFGEKDNTDKIKKRTKTVLYKMQELGYINDDECKKAIDEVENGLKFKQKQIQSKTDGIYSYHTDALISEVISDIADKNNISKEFARKLHKHVRTKNI